MPFRTCKSFVENIFWSVIGLGYEIKVFEICYLLHLYRAVIIFHLLLSGSFLGPFSVSFLKPTVLTILY